MITSSADVFCTTDRHGRAVAVQDGYNTARESEAMEVGFSKSAITFILSVGSNLQETPLCKHNEILYQEYKHFYSSNVNMNSQDTS